MLSLLAVLQRIYSHLFILIPASSQLKRGWSCLFTEANLATLAGRAMQSSITIGITQRGQDMVVDLHDAHAVAEQSMTVRAQTDYFPAPQQVIANQIHAPCVRTPGEQMRSISAPTPAQWIALTPPLNFGAVEAGKIYRSAFPTAVNFPFLDKIGIRTVVTLVDTPLTDDYRRWVTFSDINHFTWNVATNKDGVVNLRSSAVTEILDIVLNDQYYPLLIHCNRGKHRTGCVVGAFKVVLGSDLNAVMNEYSAHASPKERDGDKNFITAFDPKPNFEVAFKCGWVDASGLSDMSDDSGDNRSARTSFSDMELIVPDFVRPLTRRKARDSVISTKSLDGGNIAQNAPGQQQCDFNTEDENTACAMQYNDTSMEDLIIDDKSDP